MKTLLTIIFFVLLISCNDTSEKVKGDTITPLNTSLKSELRDSQTGDGLKQNGDYSSLFNRNEKDCEILNSAEIAKVIDLDTERVELESNQHGYCHYNITLQDNTDTRISFHILPLKKAEIKKEIKSYMEMEEVFGKDNDQGIVLISETKDTYLCIRKTRGELFLFNTNYDAALVIKFGSAIESQLQGGLSAKQKKQRMGNAVTLANYILKKYQK